MLKSKAGASQVRDEILGLLQSDKDFLEKLVESVTSCIINKIVSDEAIFKKISVFFLDSSEFKSMSESIHQEIYKSVTFDLEESSKKCATLEEQNRSLQSEINTLQDDIDNLEQYSRRNCLLIHGVKEKKDENTNHQSLKVFRDNLKLDIQSSDLDRSHRIGKHQPGKTRPIIVKFARYDQRRRVFVSKKLLKGSGIGITENLTSRRLKLLQRAKEYEKVSSAWTSDGRIICLLEDDSTIVVEKESDLNKLTTSLRRSKRR